MTIYKSPLKAPSSVHQDVYHYLFQTRKHIAPDSKDALIDAFTGQKYTYGQLRSDTLLFADGFANKHKLKQGDVILIFSPNLIHYPIPLFGGQAAGLTVSTANSGYTPPELAHQIRNSESKIVIVSSDLLPVALKALKEKDVSVKEDKVFVLPGADGDIKVEGGAKSWEELRGKKGFKPIKVTDKTKLAKFPAYRPYSSGTTGLSKGVDISHSNMVVMMEGLRLTGLSNKDDKILAVLPLYHIYGLVVLLHSIFAEGATCVVMPKFDMVKFLESVAKYKVTKSYIVPPIALGLAKHPIVDKYDLSSLKMLCCGAAPLSMDLQDLLRQRLKDKCAVIQGYGMTETTAVACIQPVEVRKANGSVGVLSPGVEARLVSPVDGKDVEKGKEGELWLRGPIIMPGYHKNDKANKDTFTSDGWLKTGDVCVVDDKSEFYVVDRTKELIKYKGFQVPPASLEAVLLTCPVVADAAVIGIHSDEQATELPRAYIVPGPSAKGKDQETIKKEVADFVASKVANHMKLRGGVIIIDAIPKSAAGKILRKDLRTLAAKEKGGKSKI